MQPSILFNFQKFIIVELNFCHSAKMMATDFLKLSRLVVILLEIKSVSSFIYYSSSSYWNTGYTIGIVISVILLVISLVACCCKMYINRHNTMEQSVPTQPYSVAYPYPGQEYSGQVVDTASGQAGQMYLGQAHASALPTAVTIGPSDSPPPYPGKNGEPPY